MGTKLGAAKTAATKIGIPVEQYLQNVHSGLQWCSGCRDFKHLEFFNKGFRSQCKSCSRVADRRRYQPIPREQWKPRGFAVHPPRDGDKQQARNRVNREVRKGKLPHARTVPCTDCGHIGGDRLHEYDHYLGYAAINHLAVECVCVPCHSKREINRRNNEL